MRQILRVGLTALAAAILLPISAYAQTGQMSGAVRDASGSALPGVLVEVSSPALIEKVRSSTTDTSGRYQITVLPIGTYTVTFSLEGFTSVKRENVGITSDFTAPVNADMKVGARSETVNVVAEAPVVDVQNARVQHVFTGAEITDLPTPRDVPSLMNLVPSLTTSSLRGTCNGGVGLFCNPTVPLFNSHTSMNDSVDGLSSGQNQGRIMVDGMVVNMGRDGTGINENVGQANGLVLDTGNAAEITFTLSGSLGESETGGASINVVPRTGGNRYAGNFSTSYTNTSFFDRNRDTRLTWTPTNPNPSVATQGYNYDYDTAGSFGGPIVKDRLWFHAQARWQAREQYPGGGITQPGFTNLNEGVYGANYMPQRNCNAPRSCAENGGLTYTNEYKNASVRLTWQVSQKNKININWDEQDACTNPCYGMISILNSPESYFALQSRPNRLQQISWTNPFTNRILFDAGVSIVATHQNQTMAREFTNPRNIPRICEVGNTVGRDEYARQVNTLTGVSTGGIGGCSMSSGSINDSLAGTYANTNDDTYRWRTSASYVTGSHNAKIGVEGAYFSEQIRNEVNDSRLILNYQTPLTTGTWNATTRSGNCLLAPADDVYACGNFSNPIYAAYNYGDTTNKTYLRPKPTGFSYNTGVGTTDETVWSGSLYIQDQWTLNRFTLNGALRYDHAESSYGSTCIGPDIYVPIQADGTNQWCSTPSKGVRYNDITPRWGVAWDVMGNGKTSIKWNMGKYLSGAGFGGLYTGYNDVRRSGNNISRAWDDLNGDRIPQCDPTNYLAHTNLGDQCGALTQTVGGVVGPSTAFQQFGRPPTSAQLANTGFFGAPSSACGLKNTPATHVEYCTALEQNAMQGWGKRRNEWQFGLGIQHELLPRLSMEVTYNWRKYGNLTGTDTVQQGCDYAPTTGATGVALLDWHTCPDSWLQYTDASNLRDFYTLEVPIDPRLPNGGGYVIRGITNQSVGGALPGGIGAITIINNELDYSWNGFDTNFVLRARGGLRLSGGTSTGRSLRNTCYSGIDAPAVAGRRPYGAGCDIWRPLQTNVRANASYTIPKVDILAGVVFQYRPGSELTANLAYTSSDVVWEAGDADRNGTQFNTGTAGVTTSTATRNILDFGDMYGEGLRLFDLKFSKNIRFARKRLNLGVDIYNLFNSDGATGYTDTFTAFKVVGADGVARWQQDNPATADQEINDWGRVDSITSPRFARFTVQFDF